MIPLLIAIILHGPIVSSVTESTAVICLRTDQAAEVIVEYSVYANLDSALTSSPDTTESGSDYTIQIKISDLASIMQYYYTAQIDGARVEMTTYPSFVTFPSETLSTDFAFTVLADASADSTASGIVYKYANKSDPDFIVMLGDFDHRDPGNQSNPADIEDWRTMHRDVIQDYESGKDFTRYIGKVFPVISMWDDHDYGANNADKYAEWKDIATQAYREYHPNYPVANADGGNWYSFRYAQAEFFVLDLRSQRDDMWDVDSTDKSMLDGDNIPDGQKDWLKDGLLYSTATWKFILSTVPWNPTVLKPDAWAGYQTERTELLNFISANGIDNVIVISGDIHTGGAVDDGTNSDLPELSVPHFNDPVPMFQSGCTAPDCGTWSEGIYSGVDNPGLGYVTVNSDSSVTLLAWSDKGQNQISFEVFVE